MEVKGLHPSSVISMGNDTVEVNGIGIRPSVASAGRPAASTADAVKMCIECLPMVYMVSSVCPTFPVSRALLTTNATSIVRRRQGNVF